MYRTLSFLRPVGSLALLALATTAFLLPGKVDAEQPGAKTLRLVFSDNPDKPTNPRPNLRLRPNTLQAFYLYVENSSDKPAEATVQLLSNGQPLDGSARVKVAGNGFQRVSFAKAATPEKTPPPAADKAAAADKGPVLAELPGPLQARLLDDKNQVLDETEVRSGRPDEYVEVTNIQFDPRDNKLSVALRAKPEFTGPRARVELVLRPDRIPALAVPQRKEGTYGGYLTQSGDTLQLEAQNLQLKGGGDRNGLVYLTIDGYQRAYTFRTTFAGDQPSEPRRIDDAILRLNAARVAVPGAPSKVGLEVDNSPVDSTIELGLYRDNKFDDVEGELIERVGDRQVRFFVNPAGPGGAMLFRTEVADWSTEMETAEIYGKRVLRLRLVRKVKDARLPLEFIDSGRPIEVLPDGSVRKTNQIVEGLVLDATKPEPVKFVSFPDKLLKGSLLPVQVTATDPESGIQQVVFFGGKPLPDGKFPPNTVTAPGQWAGKDLWVAQLPVATDKKGAVEVTVQATNGAGLTTTETVVIQLVDPGAGPAGPKGAIIEGTVIEGGRLQPDLPVFLFDPQGIPRDQTKTDAQGKYVFKDVVPGTYRIVSTKSGSRTRGEAPVQVMEGQKKLDVEVKMTR